MEVYTKSRLISYSFNSDNYGGWAFVIEFPIENSDVCFNLEKELGMSDLLILQKNQKLFDGLLGNDGDFYMVQNSFEKLIRITSDKSFSFISNNSCLEGIILETNLEKFKSLHKYSFDCLTNVVLVFKNDNNSKYYIFPINEVKTTKYRFLPTSQQMLDL